MNHSIIQRTKPSAQEQQRIPGTRRVALEDNRAPIVQQKHSMPVLNDNRKKIDASVLDVSRAVQPRSITGSKVIQRMIGFQRNTLPLALRDNLAQQITTFNTYEHSKLNTQKALHAQFKMLDDIEKTINGHLVAQGNHLGGPDRKVLFGLLRQAEREHIQLTARLHTWGRDMWLGGTNMSEKTKKQTQKLWHSLRQNQGNIKIDQGTSQNFKNETLSGFHHMLRGNHGRGLLRELNKFTPSHNSPRDKSKHVIISSNFQKEFKKYKKGGEYSPGSSAMSMSYIRRGTRDELNGTGTGSYVQIQHGKPPKKWGEYESGEHGEPIFSPKFLTLGHELGHARHNLRGQTKSQLWDGSVDESNPLHGHEDEQGKWSNPEEHRNITHEENQMRLEHGLPKRKYHATIDSGRATGNRINMDKQLAAMGRRVPKHLMKYIGPKYLVPLNTRIQGTDLSNVQLAAALQNDLDTTQNNLNSYIRWARLQHMKENPRQYLPSKKQALGGALTLGAMGLYAYNKWWSGK